VISARRTRLVRVPDLQTFRRAIAHLADESPESLIVVPTHVAARQLQRQEIRARAITRDELIDALAGGRDGLKKASDLERDGLMHAAAAADEHPPYAIRPGLIGAMVGFYDQLRRQSQSVARFRELLEQALGGGEGTDRGTVRLLRQTRFLAGAFERYERSLTAAGLADEHVVRQSMLDRGTPAVAPHVVITVADWIADPDGLFVADFDLLSRLAGIERIDVVATEAVLGSGFHERLHSWLPGIEEEDHLVDRVSSRPRLIAPTEVDPASEVYWHTFRDREEELHAVAKRIVRANGPSDRDRIAVVFKRPLPYLYLAAETLGARGLSYQAADTFPLATEPAAAAVDLVLDAIESNFTRSSLVALLRNPHLQLMEGSDAEMRRSISALDRFLSKSGYLGELARLETLDGIDREGQDALDAAIRVARALQPHIENRAASDHIRRLHGFLIANFRAIRESDAPAGRDHRARAAILDLLQGLADALAVHFDPQWTASELAASVRRWIGERTFAVDSDDRGIVLLDDQAARYADVDHLTLVGLVDDEWPERPHRNIFYPTRLLNALGWPSERDRHAAAEARFLDLLASPTTSVVLSTFTLEDEALTTRSPLLDELARARLSTVADDGATAADSEQRDVNAGSASASWRDLRAARRDASNPAFHGSVGMQRDRTWSVSAVETFLSCPFRFFAQYVLKLEDEPEDAEVMDPRRQGQFVHDVFEQFFSEWTAAGHQNVTSSNLELARQLFAAVVEHALVKLPVAEAALERTRLLGSAAAAGLGEAVLRMEAERPTPVVSRLLEHNFKSQIVIRNTSGERTVSVRGKADRIDLLADGTFRLIDYKLGWPPDKSRALQLPIYGLAAQQQLSTSSRSWILGEAAYLAFKGPRRVVPLFRSADERDEMLAKAEQRLSDALDAIDRGEFPPTPSDVYLCETCSFAAVCRKDYVGAV
jgi:RecB family exonuclease